MLRACLNGRHGVSVLSHYRFDLIGGVGHEVLSTGLPYTADEIEAVMAED